MSLPQEPEWSSWRRTISNRSRLQVLFTGVLRLPNISVASSAQARAGILPNYYTEVNIQCGYGNGKIFVGKVAELSVECFWKLLVYMYLKGFQHVCGLHVTRDAPEAVCTFRTQHRTTTGNKDPCSCTAQHEVIMFARVYALPVQPFGFVTVFFYFHYP